MKRLPVIARVLFGLVFFVFGLNGFLNFIPQPPPPPAAGAFAGAMFATGYFFPLLKATEVVSGILLLSNRFVPLALTVLAPIVINIVAFHAFLAPSGLGLAGLVLVLEVFLAWSYRGAYRGVLAARAEPEVNGAEGSPPASARAAA